MSKIYCLSEPLINGYVGFPPEDGIIAGAEFTNGVAICQDEKILKQFRDKGYIVEESDQTELNVYDTMDIQTVEGLATFYNIDASHLSGDMTKKRYIVGELAKLK